MRSHGVDAFVLLKILKKYYDTSQRMIKLNGEKQRSLKTLVLFFQNFIIRAKVNDENRKKYSHNQFLEDR